MYNLHKFHTASWQRLDCYWKLAWLKRKKTNPYLEDITILGGITIPAQINPQLEKEIEHNTNKYGDSYYPDQFYKRSTLITFLQHSYGWICLKARLVPAIWFYPTYVCNDSLSHKLVIIENYLAMICLGLCLLLIPAPFIQKRWQPVNVIYLLVFIALCSANLLTAVLIHMEPRYFFSLKFCTFIILFSILCTLCPPLKKSPLAL